MKVILKQDVQHLGHKDELVTVKDGYGRNYLIPKGLAIAATPSLIKVHNENLKQQAHKEEKLRKEASDLAKRLANKTLRVATKASSTGKIFGSVGAIQIADALKTQEGCDIERKNISLPQDNIKEVGTYEAKVKLYKDINVTIKFEVFAE